MKQTAEFNSHGKKLTITYEKNGELNIRISSDREAQPLDYDFNVDQIEDFRAWLLGNVKRPSL